MRDKKRSILIRYGVTAALAGLLAYVVTRTYGLGEARSLAERYRILSDAFAIPGVVFAMIGILIRLTDSGILDGLSYAMRSLWRVFLPMAAREDISFLDYVTLKRESRKGKKTGFILHVGLLFLVPALIFLVLFYQVRG